MSSANPSCPGRDALERFLLGRSSDAEMAAIEEHLAQCPACEESAAELGLSDTVVDLLRASQPKSDEAQFVEGLVERVCEQAATPSSEQLACEASLPSESSTPASADFLDPPQAQGELGRLGPYRIFQVLGAGGMGVVFQAEDTQLKRLVALKVLKPALAASEMARLRFLREAQSAAAIEHDHVVAIYQVGQDGHRAFLAMQWLHGETLEQRLRREPRLPLREVVRIGRQTAMGLTAAHQKN